MQIIYIHGFNSTSQSFKAQLLKKHLADGPHTLFLPDLPHFPQQAIEILDRHASQHCDQALGFVGSSLGGYYATWLADRYDAPAVLINPAVKPYELLRQGLGENRNYHTGEVYELTESHLQQLLALELDKIGQPEKLLLLTCSGDEVLDYRDGVARYQGAKQQIVNGGDHGFSEYAQFLPLTVKFLEEHAAS